MGRLCPVCGKKNVKVNPEETMVYCEEYKVTKVDGEFVNQGDCDFHIPFKQKIWGTSLTKKDMVALIEGKTLKNPKGDKMTLDLDSPYFTHIEFAEKKPSKDL